MKKLLFAAVTFCFSLTVFANEYKIDGIYPTNWWVGMKDPKLQLIVRGANVQENKVSVHHPGVKVVKVHKPENRGYLFIDLIITAAARPGVMRIHFTNPNGRTEWKYTLGARRKGKGTEYAQGVTSKDFMYLIMPDRFSNGDPSNDQLSGYLDETFSRDSMYFRHGGDLQGIANHLDYLQDLGVTALWLNPVIENDMKRTSYHGYAFTDHYKIDRRFGGDTAYKRLINLMHKRGMKMVQDAVYNHVGTNHWSVVDQPMKDWLNQWPSFTQTTYKDQVLFDPYASKADKDRMSNGWFVRSMPDLNHKNPFVATFLIQHAIWTIEEYGIDGWRIDTYAYNDLDFMNRCNKALLDEYPKLSIFGETWVHGVPNQSFFTKNKYNIKYRSNQPGVTDFQTLWGIQETLTKDFGWTDGVNKLYTTIAQDFVYDDPMTNVVFLDNHDIARFYSYLNEDIPKYKMATGWLLTTRGIPQWYYGAEILMKGHANPDGNVRWDFPGGWPGDAVNKFTSAGRTPREDSMFNYVRTLANYRKTSSAIQTGKMMQFVPEDWVYTYFRYDDKQTVMVVMNTSKEEKTLDPQRFKERYTGLKNPGQFRDIVTGVSRNVNEKWTLPGHSIWILEGR